MKGTRGYMRVYDANYQPSCHFSKSAYIYLPLQNRSQQEYYRDNCMSILKWNYLLILSSMIKINTDINSSYLCIWKNYRLFNLYKEIVCILNKYDKLNVRRVYRLFKYFIIEMNGVIKNKKKKLVGIFLYELVRNLHCLISSYIRRARSKNN